MSQDVNYACHIHFSATRRSAFPLAPSGRPRPAVAPRVRLSRICLTIAAIVSYRLGYRTANFRPHLARWQQFLPQAAPNPTPSPQPGGVQLNCTPLLFCQHDFWQREQAWASFLTLAPVS